MFRRRRKDFEKVLRSRLNEGKTLNSYTTVVIFLYSNVYVRIQVAPLVRRAVSFRPITEPFAVFNKKNEKKKRENQFKKKIKKSTLKRSVKVRKNNREKEEEKYYMYMYDTCVYMFICVRI